MTDDKNESAKAPREILSCPFCGGTAHTVMVSISHPRFQVVCTSGAPECAARGPSMRLRANAINAWNGAKRD